MQTFPLFGFGVICENKAISIQKLAVKLLRMEIQQRDLEFALGTLS
jgi:hypothetical protein